MSYHQIILTTREERPVDEDVLHDVIWNAYDTFRRTTSGFPTIRVLDVKGNITNEANRRLADGGARQNYPSHRSSRYVPGEDEPEDSEQDIAATPTQQIHDAMLSTGYPTDLFDFGSGATTLLATDNNPEWEVTLPNSAWLRFPPYATLQKPSDYQPHSSDCACDMCWSPDNSMFQTPILRALMSLAASRDDWEINLDNVNDDWYCAMSDHYYRITGERP